jgi:hypothetical protein
MQLMDERAGKITISAGPRAAAFERALDSIFAGDCRYRNRDKQVMFSETGGTISNEWLQGHDHLPVGRYSCTALRRHSGM